LRPRSAATALTQTHRRSRWSCLGATLIGVQTGLEKNTVSMKPSVLGCRRTGTGWLTAGPRRGLGRAPLRDTRITTLLVRAGGSRCQRSQTHTEKPADAPSIQLQDRYGRARCEPCSLLAGARSANDPGRSSKAIIRIGWWQGCTVAGFGAVSADSGTSWPSMRIEKARSLHPKRTLVDRLLDPEWPPHCDVFAISGDGYQSPVQVEVDAVLREQAPGPDVERLRQPTDGVLVA
jgi:hypothetical protein